MDESLIVCQSCGSVVRRDEVRGNCMVCNKKTCIACSRICDECLKIVCQNCIKVREIWIDGNLYLRKMLALAFILETGDDLYAFHNSLT